MGRSSQRNNAYFFGAKAVTGDDVTARVFRKCYYMGRLSRGAAHGYAELLATAPFESLRKMFEGEVVNTYYDRTR
jgi:hypothetical protein